MDVVVEDLKHSPKLALYAEQIQRVLEEERQKRLDFYEQKIEGQKSEFINGEVIFHSPLRFRHIEVGKRLLELLDIFVRLNHLGFVGHEKMMISLTRNDYEPDICYFRPEKAKEFSPDQVRFPAPDLVVEILSPNTEHNDRTIKLIDYAAHGVEEYWIVDPKQEFVEQYVLEGEDYQLRAKAYDGVLKSVAVTGFTLSVRALFDEKENLDALRKTVNN